MSLNEEFFAAKPRLKEFKVEGMDKPVFLRPLSLEQRGEFGDNAKNAEGKSAKESLRLLTIPLIVGGVCDEDGKPIFSEDNTDRLMGYDGGILIGIQEAILEHSGLGAKARENLEKNLEKTPADSQSSQ